MRTESEILTDMNGREDRMTRCNPGEDATFFALRDKGIIYNYTGSVYGLCEDGVLPEPLVAHIRGGS